MPKISVFTQKKLDGDFANRQQSFGLLKIGKNGFTHIDSALNVRLAWVAGRVPMPY